MASVAVATSSQLAADAADEVAQAGGNAVDCALAASLMAMNTEPGVCALAGSAFVTVWRENEEPITIDGNVAVPGIGLSQQQRHRGVERVAMEYGGGIETLVGAGSVGVPGSLAAVASASEKFGAVNWSTLFEPTIRATRAGFPLSAACHYYLRYSGNSVFGRSAEGHAALHDEHGQLRSVASDITVPGLADSLQGIADEGAELFYQGELGATVVEHCRAANGALTQEDLANYRAIERPPIVTEFGAWDLACNPSPAVGGAVLTAMLMSATGLSDKSWHAQNLQHLINVQRHCLQHRKRYIDLANDVAQAVDSLLESAQRGAFTQSWGSGSTVHTSAVDSDGTACAITASSGYGSGEIPPGTGLWLNNSLGELELNRRGLNADPVGSRLPSNMNPSIARRRNGSHVFAFGSPGADRITTAMQQFLINYLQFDMTLEDAIAHPRLHVDTSSERTRLMAEPGLSLPDVDMQLQQFSEIGMYFGGVGVAEYASATGLTAAADPRREGGICLHID